MSKPFVPEKSTTKPPALTSSTRFAKGRALLLRGALLFFCSFEPDEAKSCGERLEGRLRRFFLFVPSLPAPGAGVMEQGYCSSLIYCG